MSVHIKKRRSQNKNLYIQGTGRVQELRVQRLHIPRGVSSIFSSDHSDEGAVSSELIAAESPETGRVMSLQTKVIFLTL